MIMHLIRFALRHNSVTECLLIFPNKCRKYKYYYRGTILSTPIYIYCFCTASYTFYYIDLYTLYSSKTNRYNTRNHSSKFKIFRLRAAFLLIIAKYFVWESWVYGETSGETRDLWNIIARRRMSPDVFSRGKFQLRVSFIDSSIEWKII